MHIYSCVPSRPAKAARLSIMCIYIHTHNTYIHVVNVHIIQHTYISHGMLSKLAAKRHFAQLRNLFLRLMLRLPALGRRAPAASTTCAKHVTFGEGERMLPRVTGTGQRWSRFLAVSLSPSPGPSFCDYLAHHVHAMLLIATSLAPSQMPGGGAS